MSGSVPAEAAEAAAPDEAAPVPLGGPAAVALPHASSAAAAAVAPAAVVPEAVAHASGAPVGAAAAVLAAEPPATEAQAADLRAADVGPAFDAAAAVDTKFEDAPSQPTDAASLELHPGGELVAEDTTDAAVEPPQTGVPASGEGEEAAGGGGQAAAVSPAAAAPLVEVAEVPPEARAAAAREDVGGLPVGVQVDVAMASDDDESDSPDEVPLNGEGGPGGGLGMVVQPVVAGVPQAAPRSGAAAPAVAIPVGGMHAAAEPAAGGGGKADAAAPSAHAPVAIGADGTMLAEHPPLTPVQPDVDGDAGAEGAAMPNALQEAAAEPGVGGMENAGGAAVAAAAVQQDPADGGAASADPPAGKAGASKPPEPVSQPAKLSSRRRGRGSGAAAAAAAAAVSALAPAVEVAAVSGDVVQPTTGMRTRGRGTSAQAMRLRDEATAIKTYVREVMEGFQHPETTLVRELRLEMEHRFGVELNTFMERKDDVADALGEFFTDLGYAERC